MEIADQPSSHQEVAQPNQLTVTEISFEEFEKLAKTAKGAVELEETQWQEVEAGRPIKSEGAHVCLTVYARNNQVGSMISGHFPETVRENSREYIAEAIKRNEDAYKNLQATAVTSFITPSNVEELRLLQYEISDGYDQYLTMLDRIKELVETNDQNAIEIFLFGQNAALTDIDGKPIQLPHSAMQEQLKTQFGVLSELLRRGISPTQIHDYRKVGLDQINDTLYLPDRKTLFYTSESVENDES